jgi:hypothetical protein
MGPYQSGTCQIVVPRDIGMSFFAQCPDIGACQGAFQNDANVRSNRKQGRVSMHHFETPTTVHL